MDKSREKLRSILCTDEDIDEAILVLENLARRNSDEPLELLTYYDSTFKDRLVRSGLINEHRVPASGKYYTITKKGLEFYMTLAIRRT